MSASTPFVYTVRVSYADTDRMGFVHHSRYLVYMESARTELLRATGQSYLQWEESGVLLPVVGIQIDFRKPGYYDDIVHVETEITDVTRLRLAFRYRIHCPARAVEIAVAESAHVFMNKEGRPVRVGPEILDSLRR